MRKIMFRGQTRRFGEKNKNYAGEPMESAWVFGYGAVQGNGDFSIIYGSEKGPDTEARFSDKHIIYSDTLGQYVGFNDCNNKPIFEGDIAVYHKPVDPWGPDLPEGAVGTVEYSGSAFYFAVKKSSLESSLYLLNNFYGAHGCILEVIGNIFDNLDLLVGKVKGTEVTVKGEKA